MPLYTRRIQTTLTDQQFAELSRLASAANKPISALIREALEVTYFTPQERQRRLQALDQLLSMNAPTGDWEKIEEEIIWGATE